MTESSVESTFGEYENERSALQAAIRAVDAFLDGLRVEAAALFDRVEEAHSRLDDNSSRVDALERGRPTGP